MKKCKCWKGGRIASEIEGDRTGLKSIFYIALREFEDDVAKAAAKARAAMYSGLDDMIYKMAKRARTHDALYDPDPRKTAENKK